MALSKVSNECFQQANEGGIFEKMNRNHDRFLVTVVKIPSGPFEIGMAAEKEIGAFFCTRAQVQSLKMTLDNHVPVESIQNFKNSVFDNTPKFRIGPRFGFLRTRPSSTEAKLKQNLESSISNCNRGFPNRVSFHGSNKSNGSKLVQLPSFLFGRGFRSKWTKHEITEEVISGNVVEESPTQSSAISPFMNMDDLDDDNESTSSLESWSDEEERELPVAPFLHPNEGEELPFQNDVVEKDYERQLNFLTKKLGFAKQRKSPLVLFTLWSGRTINEKLNVKYAEFMLLHKNQSIGVTCGNFFIRKLLRYHQEGWKPTSEIYAAISCLDNERLILISCLDEVFYGRDSSLLAKDRCFYCHRHGQHWTNNCFWHWETSDIDLLCVIRNLCAGCHLYGCKLGKASHLAHAAANPHLNLDQCGNCKSWKHRTWNCLSAARFRVERIIKMRLILTAYVTLHWSNEDFRRLLDGYCDLKVLPKFVISDEMLNKEPDVAVSFCNLQGMMFHPVVSKKDESSLNLPQ